jgi:hypothetical protein
MEAVFSDGGWATGRRLYQPHIKPRSRRIDSGSCSCIDPAPALRGARRIPLMDPIVLTADC